MVNLYQTQFDSFEGLQSVLSAVQNFNEGRLQDALTQRRINWTTREIREIDTALIDAKGKLEIQYYDLEEFSKIFNKQFVTTNNAYFNSAYQLLRQVKSGTSQIKKLYKKFTPNSSAARKALPRQNQSLIYDQSSIGNGSYNLPLYPLDTYAPPEVIALCKNMQEFFDLMAKSMLLCLDVMRDEAMYRRDPIYCCTLYHDYKDEVSNRLGRLIHSIQIDTQDFDPLFNPAIDMRNNAKSEADFAQNGFHALLKEDVDALCAKEIVEKIRLGDITQEEGVLWPTNLEIIKVVRNIINHFDDYLPENYNRKTLPSVLMASLFIWSNATTETKFVEYIKHEYHGKLSHVPDNAAVSQKKKEINTKDRSKAHQYYLELKKQWDLL